MPSLLSFIPGPIGGALRLFGAAKDVAGLMGSRAVAGAAGQAVKNTAKKAAGAAKDAATIYGPIAAMGVKSANVWGPQAARDGAKWMAAHPWKTAAVALPVGGAMLGGYGSHVPTAQALGPQSLAAMSHSAFGGVDPTQQTATPQAMLNPQVDMLMKNLQGMMDSQAYSILNGAMGIQQAYNPALHVGALGQQAALDRFNTLNQRIDAAQQNGQLYAMAPGTMGALLSAIGDPYKAALTALPNAATAAVNAAAKPTELANNYMRSRAAVANAAANQVNALGSSTFNLTRANYMPYTAASDATHAQAALLRALVDSQQTGVNSLTKPVPLDALLQLTNGMYSQAIPQAQATPVGYNGALPAR